MQPFGGVQNWSHPNTHVPGYVAPGNWSGLFWIRLAIAIVAIGLSLFGACVSAVSR